MRVKDTNYRGLLEIHPEQSLEERVALCNQHYRIHRLAMTLVFFCGILGGVASLIGISGKLEIDAKIGKITGAAGAVIFVVAMWIICNIAKNCHIKFATKANAKNGSKK